MPDFIPPCCLVLIRWTFFHQWTRQSSLSKQGSNWQNQLRQASLLRHIMTPALHHD